MFFSGWFLVRAIFWGMLRDMTCGLIGHAFEVQMRPRGGNDPWRVFPTERGAFESYSAGVPIQMRVYCPRCERTVV